MRYGYARVSSEDQDLSLQLAAFKQADVEQVIEEKRSGAADDRPRLLELLAVLGPDDELVVWKLDRLGRNFRHLHDTVFDLERRGVKFVSLREHIDTSTALGRLFFILLAAFAEFEREIIRECTLAGLAEVRARGFVFGHRLYGFEFGNNNHVDTEVTVIEDIVAWTLDGGTWRGIAQRLNDEQIPTSRGKRWTATAVRRVLGHDRMAEIIGPERHIKVLEKLNEAADRIGRPASHLLSGFVFCILCGTPMYVSRHRRKAGLWVYKCKRGNSKYPDACGRLSISAEPLEALVTEELWEHWRTYEAVTEDDTHDAAMLVADLEAKLEDLAQRVRGGLSMEFALPLEAGWREDLAHARRQRDAAVKVVGYRRTPADIEAWEHSTLQEQRALLRSLGLRIDIRPDKSGGRRFDRSRVQVTFSG